MKKDIFLILILLWSVLLMGEWINVNDNAEDSQFGIIDQRSDGLEVSFKLQGYEEEEITVASQTYTRITCQGSGEFLEIGKPDLPRFSKLIAIPATGNVSIEVISKSSSIISGFDIYPRQPLQSESKRTEIPFTIDNQYYRDGDIFPAEYCTVSDPAIMRDLRVVTLTINPFRYDAQLKQLEIIEEINIRVNFNNFSGINPKQRNNKQSLSFASMYESVILNYEKSTRDEEMQRPSYLFIYPNNTVMNYLGELIDWKKKKGFEVNAVTVSEAGSTLSNIKDYIENAYYNWDNPPEFVCLVGDANGGYAVPTGHFSAGQYNGEGDHYYTMLEGDDYLSDIFIGRLSFSTQNELATIISKILNYEKMPYLTNTDWYNEILLVGDPTDSGPSCVDTKLYVGQKMEQFNPTYNLNEVYLGNWVTNIASNLNNGVLYFNYRGFANMSGWSINNISALNNGYMLPVAVAITCNTGNFEGYQDCISERFLKAGTPTVPKGAIAAISTATGNTHTCFNNCLDAGIFEGIFVDNIFHMGGALNRGKMNLNLNYPENPNSYVEKFSYWNNLMGDPGMELWTTTPEEFSIAYEQSVSSGTNYLDVLVGNDAGEPLEGAWVTARTDNDEILSSQYTDIGGNAQLDISSDYLGSVSLVVTKHDFIPHIGDFTIETTPEFVSIDSYQFAEISGNGDEIINAGEEIELELILKNHGSQLANDITVTLSSSLDLIDFSVNQLNYNNILSGDTSTPNNPAVLSLDSSIPEGTEIMLNVDIQSGDNYWQDYLYLQVGGAFLRVLDYTIIDNDNNILDPGEEVNLQIEIENIGSNDLTNLTIQLETTSSNIDINDNTINLTAISAGETINISDFFNIEADLLTIPGNQIPMVLNVASSEGFEQEILFMVDAGIVEVTHPLGPDNYGHYIYDNDDIVYINTMAYDWVEIDPDNGGPGEELVVGDAGNMGFVEHRELPFSMTFYGVTYDSLTICTNGWLSPGITDNQSFMNWMIPGAPGPSPIIAVFWDDLLMGSMDGQGQYLPNGSSVCYYYNPIEHYFVIQWSGVLNEYDLSEEIFQCLIYDLSYYPTNTGDNIIKMQYHTINNVDQGGYESFLVSHGMYATVGIENHLSDDGIQYTYNNEYPLAAKMLESETALTISGAPINSDEAYLVVNNLTIENSDADEFIENGEDAELYVNLTNMGATDAVNITAEITTDDEYLIINSASAVYPDIISNESAPNTNPFEITIADNAPDRHSAYFLISISCNTGSWQVPLHLTLSGPDLRVIEVNVEDSNNQMLDPSETAVISFSIKNLGDAPAIGMQFELESLNSHVNSEDIVINIPILEPDQIFIASLEISADEFVEITDSYDVEWSLSNNQGYDFEDDFDMYITQFPLQFEEEFNEFPPPGWIIDGENWFLNYTSNAGGTLPEIIFWGEMGFAGTQRIITPPLKTLGSNQIRLQFKHTLEGIPGEFSWGVQVSTDLENWNTVEEFDGTDEFFTNENIILNAPQIGTDSLYVSLFITGNSNSVSIWFIDDLQINYIPFDPPAFIVGQVSIDDGNTQMNDVLISAGEFITTPDEDGHYLLNVQPGTFAVKAFKPGYLADFEEDVYIEELWSETTIDFILEEIDNSYTPENLTAEADVFQTILTWDIPGSNGSNTGRDIFSQNANDNILNRNLAAYKIYRDNQLITTVSDISDNIYIDGPLDEDTYQYYVAAVYDDGVEANSEVVEVEIILPVPQNFVVSTTPSGGNVIMNWQSPNEYVTSYRVYRDGELLDDQLATYYIDIAVEEGTYLYGVSAMYEEVESDRVEQEIDVTDSEDLIPLQNVMYGNYPNPFNPVTTIKFALSEPAEVKIYIYNTKGSLVRKLVNSNLVPSTYSYNWEGKDDLGKQVGSGVYIYRMRLDGSTFALGKMILMK